MQAAAGHHIGAAAKDFDGAFLDGHKFEQSQLAALMIEKQIDVGVAPSLVARR
jgi:hypothetical protein